MFVPERKATQAGPILFRERPALHWWARDFVGFSLSDTLRLGKFYVVAGRGLSVLAEARHHFLLWPGATLPCSLMHVIICTDTERDSSMLTKEHDHQHTRSSHFLYRLPYSYKPTQPNIPCFLDYQASRIRPTYHWLIRTSMQVYKLIQ